MVGQKTAFQAKTFQLVSLSMPRREISAGRTRDVANVTGEEDRLVLANCWGKVGNRRATNPLPAQGGSEENNKVELYRGPVIGIGTL